MLAHCRELSRARWWSPGMKTCPVLGAWPGDSCVLTSRRQAGGGARKVGAVSSALLGPGCGRPEVPAGSPVPEAALPPVEGSLTWASGPSAQEGCWEAADMLGQAPQEDGGPGLSSRKSGRLSLAL